MSVRAIIIGLLLGLPLACFGWLNDWVLGQAYVAGDHIPASVYGLLLLGLLGLNPLLKVLGGRQLKGSEWSVIVAMMLMACVIPGPGLLWTFNNALIMPHQFIANNPGWTQKHYLDYIPPQMLVDAGDKVGDPLHYERVIKGFANGLRTTSSRIGWGDVPWDAWARPLWFWLPLLGMGFVGGVCLVLLVHRQWAHRERLRYPIAEFAGEVLGGAGENTFARIFHNQRFWIGFGIAFGILMVNGTFIWGRDFKWNFIEIPMYVNMQSILGEKFPFLKSYPSAWPIWNVRWYFVVIGIAYFVSSEVSFTLGISPFLHLAMYYVLFQYTDLLKSGSDYLGGGFFASQYFGAYLGMGLIILYIGRRFYGTVFLNALGIATRERAAASETWACRAAVLCAAGMIALLVSIGLDWLLAVLVVFLTGLLFLLVTRVNVETGLFSVQPTWHAVGILVGIFGVTAMGPKTLVILGLLSAVMTIDPKIACMPMAANALRLSEKEGVSPVRLTPVLAGMVVLALVAGVVVTLYFQYDQGGANKNGWLNAAAQLPLEMMAKHMPTFENEGLLQSSFSLARMHFDGKFWGPVAIGFGGVLVLSLLRLRFQWWPIHPVLLLVWGTFPVSCFANSFLLGWLLKAAITKFGGGDAYRQNKPLFVGLVAGELGASIVWVIIGLCYYVLNNSIAGPSVRFRV